MTLKSKRKESLKMAANIIKTKNDRIIYIPTDKITPNRSQPRNDFDQNSIVRLADSIRRYGLIQPLTVRLNGDRYELIAGERRLRACKLLGYLQVPCVIRSANERVSAEIALIENLMRDNLNMFEQAKAFRRLITEFGLTQEQVAKSLSMSQSAVANKLRLLRLSDEEMAFILDNLLTERHARAILRIKDRTERRKILEHISQHKLNVSLSEQYIEKAITSSFELAPRHSASKCDVLKKIEDILKRQFDKYDIIQDRQSDESSQTTYRVFTIRIPEPMNVSRETFA